MKPKIIVIEGLDASGKETQTKLLAKNLNAKRITFPNYDSFSSILVKLYLKNILKVSAKTACWFYAIDRFITMKKYQNTTETLILDRYTTANMVHQVGRLDKEDWDSMVEYIEELEYNKFKLPRPAKVIALTVPPKISRRNVLKRGHELDVLEKDEEFFTKSYDALNYIASKQNWELINCMKDSDNMKSIEEIQKEIIKKAVE